MEEMEILRHVNDYRLHTDRLSTADRSGHKLTTVVVGDHDDQRLPYCSPASRIMLLDNDVQCRYCHSLLQPRRFLYDRCSRRFLA